METPEDEPHIISDFFQFINKYSYIITYNGLGFDIPYVLDKCKHYNIPYDFSKHIIKDLYKEISPIKKIFMLENIKQKSIENFLNIHRNDKFNGGQLISIFSDYLKTKQCDLEELILLHNKEDIIGLFKILPILNYKSLFNGLFIINSIEILYNKEDLPKEVIVDTKSTHTIPTRISFGNNIYYVSAYNNTMKIKISIYNGGLKFFYTNYKDYYYLPEEDCSIHKSIAFYVDKNYRTKANAANCYSKKTGRFLRQYNEIINPFFKIDYHDKITYFELTNEIIDNPTLLKEYVIDIINNLTKKEAFV
jgi:hypothetical protein